jgi:CheY-like chemotaxis protein
MKLEYTILWIENDQFWFDSIEDDVRDILENERFIPEIRLEHDGSNILTLLKNNQWDLILVDYNLGKNKDKGDSIIEKIRNNQFTSIIFYSQAGPEKLRQEISKKSIDGIYCADRKRVEFLLKVEQIINITIKKATELNPLRGLVMAETSEIDDLMRDILLIFMNNPKYKDKHQDLLKYICTKKIQKSLRSIGKRVGDYCNDGNYTDLIKYFIFDSSKKSSTIDKMINYINDDKLNTLKKIGLNYQSEIINRRNLLAHVSQEERNGIKILKSYLPNQDEIIFDVDLCKKIRQDITVYKNKFEEIKRLISE